MLEYFLFLAYLLQIPVNGTVTVVPQQQQQDNTFGVNALVATAVTTAAGLVTKHIYDNRQRKEITKDAADIDKIQMQELADNYNDFAILSYHLELLFRLVIKNPELKIADLLDFVVDDITGETMGQRLVLYCKNIQKWNMEYYKNSALFSKADSTMYSSKNPLQNVRDMVKDMSTPSTEGQNPP